jgi:hypothetical protein
VENFSERERIRKLKDKARERTDREIDSGAKPKGTHCNRCNEAFPYERLTPHHTDYFSDPPDWEWVCQPSCHRARHEEAGDMDEQALDFCFGRGSNPNLEDCDVNMPMPELEEAGFWR